MASIVDDKFEIAGFSPEAHPQAFITRPQIIVKFAPLAIARALSSLSSSKAQAADRISTSLSTGHFVPDVTCPELRFSWTATLLPKSSTSEAFNSSKISQSERISGLDWGQNTVLRSCHDNEGVDALSSIVGITHCRAQAPSLSLISFEAKTKWRTK